MSDMIERDYTDAIDVHTDVDTIIKNTVAEYIRDTDMEKKNPDDARSEILTQIQSAIEIENAGREKSSRLDQVKKMTPYITAKFLIASEKVKNIQMSNLMLPAVYVDKGTNEGIWKLMITKEDDRYLRELGRRYYPTMSLRELEEVRSFISDTANMEALKVTTDPDYVACANGVYNIKTGRFISWDDARLEGLVFTSKLAVNYNQKATDKVFHDSVNKRDITSEQVIREIAGDDEHYEAVVAAMHLMLRKNWSSDTAVMLVDPRLTGANGKSSICVILQEILGIGNYACIPINDMNKPFVLTPLLTCAAVINADADDNTYVASSDMFKRLAGGDPIDVSVKFKEPVSGFRFSGHIFQAVNGFPHFNDVSDAIDRRFYFIDCNAHFKLNKNKDIKDRFLRDPEVLEFWLKTILEKRYKQLPEFDFQTALKKEFRSETNPVDGFLDYVTDPETRNDGQSHWDGYYPISWLYSAFCGYYYDNYRKRATYSTKKFGVSLRAWAEKHAEEWEVPMDSSGKAMKVAHRGRMDYAEMLTAEFFTTEAGNYAEAKAWTSNNPKIGKPDAQWQPDKLKPKYACLRRKGDADKDATESKARWSYYANDREQINAAVQAFEASIAPTTTVQEHPDKAEPWTCACGTANAGGNYCEHCGGKRPVVCDNPYTNKDTVATSDTGITYDTNDTSRDY